MTKNRFDLSVEESRQSLRKQYARHASPGDEVDLMRVKKRADKQAEAVHRLLQSAKAAGCWTGQ